MNGGGVGKPNQFNSINPNARIRTQRQSVRACKVNQPAAESSCVASTFIAMQYKYKVENES